MDIMAQQLKFVACLKILMEELSTLALGCEVDGGQLRYQLYLWLEREVEALRQLCNYSPGDIDTPDIACKNMVFFNIFTKLITIFSSCVFKAVTHIKTLIKYLVKLKLIKQWQKY